VRPFSVTDTDRNQTGAREDARSILRITIAAPMSACDPKGDMTCSGYSAIV